MVPFYFFGPKARALGEKFGFVTQAEILEDRFNSKWLSGILAVLTVVVLIPYLTLQMKGAGLVLNTISEGFIPVWLGAGIAYVVVLIYVFFFRCNGRWVDQHVPGHFYAGDCLVFGDLSA